VQASDGEDTTAKADQARPPRRPKGSAQNRQRQFTAPAAPRESIEQRMLRERRAELKKTNRAARDVGQLARAVRSAIRRADAALGSLRDYLNACYPQQSDLLDDRRFGQNNAAGSGGTVPAGAIPTTEAGAK
jgi:hypothetical protein